MEDENKIPSYARKNLRWIDTRSFEKYILDWPKIRCSNDGREIWSLPEEDGIICISNEMIYRGFFDQFTNLEILGRSAQYIFVYNGSVSKLDRFNILLNNGLVKFYSRLINTAAIWEMIRDDMPPGQYITFLDIKPICYIVKFTKGQALK